MNVRARLAAWVGYDPRVVAELDRPQQTWLAIIGGTAAFPVALIGVGAGYGLWLAGGALWVVPWIMLFMGAVVLNLMRIITAGGGDPAAGRVQGARLYTPSFGPLVLFVFLGMFHAQPVLLRIHAHTLDPSIEKYRESILHMHEQALLSPIWVREEDVTKLLAAADARLAAERKRIADTRKDLAAAEGGEKRTYQRSLERELRREEGIIARQAELRKELEALRAQEAQLRKTSLAAYEQHAHESAFLVRRIRELWQEPWQALGESLVFVLLVLLPLLLARTFARHAVRAHERSRGHGTHSIVRHTDERIGADIRQAIAEARAARGLT